MFDLKNNFSSRLKNEEKIEIPFRWEESLRITIKCMKVLPNIWSKGTQSSGTSEAKRNSNEQNSKYRFMAWIIARFGRTTQMPWHYMLWLTLSHSLYAPVNRPSTPSSSQEARVTLTLRWGEANEQLIVLNSLANDNQSHLKADERDICSHS